MFSCFAGDEMYYGRADSNDELDISLEHWYMTKDELSLTTECDGRGGGESFEDATKVDSGDTDDSNRKCFCEPKGFIKMADDSAAPFPLETNLNPWNEITQ